MNKRSGGPGVILFLFKNDSGHFSGRIIHGCRKKERR